jgi:Protein of unknown function (DUF4232)
MIAPPKPPAHDELGALIKEARERQLRRRLLGAAGVAIAAALGLAVYAVTLGGGNQAATASGSPIGAPPLCRSSEISANGGLNGATGTMLGPVTLTNTSGSACSLPTGQPRVRILWRGRVLPAQETGGKNFSPAPPVHVLAPHSKAAITMDWSNWCGKPGAGTLIRPTFQLRWADGLEVDAVNDPALTPPRCGSPSAGAAIAVSVPERY